jgi:two-component sensor histidine kinase
VGVCPVRSETLPVWSEVDRLAALRSYRVLDTEPEADFDDIVHLVAQICETPFAAIILVDDRRQWFKAEHGLALRETPLELSICSRAILQRGVLVVPDLTQDPRFSANPLVTGSPHLRFYAGAVLETPDGLPLGTLCVLDRVPRELQEAQLLALKRLARQVMSQLELRRAIGERDEALAASRQTQARQALLVRELHHRVRNTLAMVQALVSATGKSASNMNAFYEAFSARVSSLAQTQTLLTEDYWQTARLRDMLRHELEPFRNGEADQIVLDGPPLELAADLAIPVGMALHELTTNSVKYGALSVANGRLVVRWELRDTEGRRKLHLDWRESGGPPVTAPTRTGFGSTMLERVLPAQAGADVDIKFDPAGLHFEMEAPLIEHRLVPEY